MTSPEPLLEGRTSLVQWTPMELSAKKISDPKMPEDAMETFDLTTSLDSSEESVTLHGEVTAVLPGFVEYVVKISGEWSHDLGRTPSEEELEGFTSGPGLRELLAVMNFELGNLGARLSTPYPVLDFNQLA